MNKICIFGKERLKVNLTILFLLSFFSGFCQDTIYCRKVKISETVGISRKTGRILYANPKWETVQSGFIIKKSDTLYLINNKEYKPGDHKPLKIKK